MCETTISQNFQNCCSSQTTQREKENDKETGEISGTNEGRGTTHHRRGCIGIKKQEAYLYDTIDTTLKIVKECVEYLRKKEISNDEIEKIEIGIGDSNNDIIFDYMTKLHGLQFGRFTDDTLNYIKPFVVTRLLMCNNNKLFSMKGVSKIYDVVGLLNVIIRIFIHNDIRCNLGKTPDIYT